jgi:hypothetical protein
MAQVVEHLPSNGEALSSFPITQQNTPPNKIKPLLHFSTLHIKPHLLLGYRITYTTVCLFLGTNSEGVEIFIMF